MKSINCSSPMTIVILSSFLLSLLVQIESAFAFIHPSITTRSSRSHLFRSSSSTAFHSTSSTRTNPTTTTRNSFFYLSAAASSSNDNNDNNDDDEDDDDDRRGMVEAFTDLDSLSSLTDLSSIDPTLIKSSSSNNNNDNEIIINPIQPTNDDTVPNSDILPTTSTEDEAKMYTELYSELESTPKIDVYDGIIEDLSEDDPAIPEVESSSASSNIINDADGIGATQTPPPSQSDTLTAINLSQDTDEFVKTAMEEALAEVREDDGSDDGLGDDVMSSIMGDGELMEEINEIFEKANRELLQSVEEMREEQSKLTKQALPSTSSAQARSKTLSSEAERLTSTEQSLSTLVSNVKRETQSVQEAMAELEQSQKQLLDDPLYKASDLKQMGIVTRGALVGGILFAGRSLGDVVMMTTGMGGDGSLGAVEEHLGSAVVQGGIALVCAVYFWFTTRR